MREGEGGRGTVLEGSKRDSGQDGQCIFGGSQTYYH